MKQTESCRLVRGAWEVCIEYLHKPCTERGDVFLAGVEPQGDDRQDPPVGCTGMRPLYRRSIERMRFDDTCRGRSV